MCYRPVILMLLMLLAMLSVLDILAAPAPDPSAILDIGPPPKGKTAEEYCKGEIDYLKSDSLFCTAYNVDPEFRELPAVNRVKGPQSWLERNLRILEEVKGRRLRLTLRVGTRVERATIINGLLRADLKDTEDRIKRFEKIIQRNEKDIADLERHIKLGLFRFDHDNYRKGIKNLRSIYIPANRAEIARLKQFTVIKWAR